MRIVSVEKEKRKVPIDSATGTRLVDNFTVKIWNTPLAAARLLRWNNTRSVEWRYVFNPPLFGAVKRGHETEPHLLHLHVRDVPDELAAYTVAQRLLEGEE